jgi:cell division protein ZapA
MDRRTIELRIAGQSYRVVSSAAAEELRHLAGIVEAKLAELGPRVKAQPQAMLLAALALAHDAQNERDRRESLERRTRDLLRRVLVRIDDALEPYDQAEAAPSE